MKRRKDEKVIRYYCTKCKKKHILKTKTGKAHSNYLGYKGLQ